MLPWFTKYPNQNDEILNLDWVIRQVENLKAAYEAFIAANSLTFADPIVWDITKQYSMNTIVLSPEGDAFLSKKAVGAGIQLNNTEYWLEIFNFADYVRTANSNLTVHIELNTTRATAAYAVDDWLLWEDVLYRVTTAIAADDLLTVGTNIVHFTVEDFCRTWQSYMINTIAQYKADIDASELAYKQQLDGVVLQYKNDIDASELAYKNDLSATITSTTSSLQAQLNAAIAGATVDSEVINARVGADGVTYVTLGDAIRTQFTNVISELYNITDFVADRFSWTLEKNIDGSGNESTNAYTALSNLMPVTGEDIIVRTGNIYDANSNLLVFYVNEYKDGVWQKRTGVSTAAPLKLESTTNGIRIGFGRQAASGITITRAAIDEYFKCSFIQTLADEATSFKMHGNILKNGYTSVDAITKQGSYNFSTNDIPYISGLPDEITQGGLLNVYTNIRDASPQIWQEIKNNSYTFIRYGVSEWKKINDTTEDFKMRGNVITLGYTSFGECTESGAYTFTTANLESITDAPDGLHSGGLLITYKNGTTIWQEVINLRTTYRRYSTSGAWFDLNKNIEISTATDEGADNSVAQINIDIQSKTQAPYLRYAIGHCIDEDVNADIWRLMYIYRLSSDKVTATPITRKGEFECALHLAGADDFVGGVIHGDEIIDDITFICDGIPVLFTNLTGSYNNVKIIRSSTLYDPSDHTTAIATHGVEYNFTKEGLTIKQSVKWLASKTLTRCYLAMYPLLKTYSTYRYSDNDFDIVENDLTDYDAYYPNSKCVSEFGNNIFSEFSIGEYPAGMTGGDTALVTDNGGLSYNKIYFVICTSGTVAENDLWKSESHYNIIL